MGVLVEANSPESSVHRARRCGEPLRDVDARGERQWERAALRFLKRAHRGDAASRNGR
jgi:hypothetical protein